LNLLLYDSVTQGAATFLSHRVLYELPQEEKHAMLQLIREKALTPIFMKAGDNFAAVANRMVEENTLAWVSHDELLQHAESLDSACPVFGYDPRGFEEVRRLQFLEMLRAVRLIESGEASSVPFSVALPRPGSLTWFLRWLEHRPKAEIGVGAVHAFLAEPSQTSQPYASDARIIALAAHSKVMGRNMAIAGCNRLNPYTALLGLPESHERSGSPRVEIENLGINDPLPYDEMANLPLTDIAQLRNRGAFPRARRFLADVRAGANSDRSELTLCLEEAAVDFEKYMQIRPGIRLLLPAKREEWKRRLVIHTAWNIGVDAALVAGGAVTLFQLSSVSGTALVTIVGGVGGLAGLAGIARGVTDIVGAISEYSKTARDFGYEYARPSSETKRQNFTRDSTGGSKHDAEGPPPFE
jgi:hypothetical protein